MVGRNCSSFLIKRNKQTYSTEPNNLTACNSFHYTGLIHRKMVGVEPSRWQRHGARHEAESQPAKAGHLSCADCRQQEHPGPPQQHGAHDPQEQITPGSPQGPYLQSQRHPAQPEAQR
ncbi:60S ribosomal protein L28 [Pteropus alecto]|uniref:Large ribosomal subunit protein eL28 n=1 Tax=Pteropus alecto TaxID=9402 RepID=L5K956_PTEAL|nr:60S ribosomal protein L28 [Pteropus alecto]